MTNDDDPTLLATRAVSEAVTPMLQTHDPRALVRALLSNAVRLSQAIVDAKRWTAQDVAMEFSQALCATLEPREPPKAKESSRIVLTDATGAIRPS